MRRFFFNLQGAQNTSDLAGLLYAGDLEAFRAAQRLARDLSTARPPVARKYLRGDREKGNRRSLLYKYLIAVRPPQLAASS